MDWHLGVVLSILVACGGKEKEAAPPPEVVACLATDAKACFRAGYYYQRIDGNEHLDRAIEMWTRGCERGDGMSCGSLGIIVDTGMSGRTSNPEVARSFFVRACNGGDKDSCRRLGITTPDTPIDIDWAAALPDVITSDREPGPVFAGHKLGEPFPAAVQKRVDAWAKKFSARIHADVRDPSTRGGGSLLAIYFDRPAGLVKAILAKFGRPERDTGFWTDPVRHTQLSYYGDARVASLIWMPYKSIDEQVLPDDTTRLGLESIPLVGATIETVQAAQPDRHVFRDGAEDWSFYDYGTGPITVRLETVRESVIKRARFDIITNHPLQTVAFIEAMTKKLGKPASTKTAYVWRKGARRYSIDKPGPNSGNINLLVE